MLDQAVVTASRTGEADAQRLPMAVSVVGSRDIDRLQDRTVEDIAGRAPNVFFTQNTGWGQSRSAASARTRCSPGRIRVRRCISTASTSLDRRWRSASSSISIASKCFAARKARSTDATRSGGAINLISRPPTNELQAAAAFTAGNFGALPRRRAGQRPAQTRQA